MPSITCSCGKTLNIREGLAGKSVKCPGCGAPVAVPLANAPAVVASPRVVVASSGGMWKIVALLGLGFAFVALLLTAFLVIGKKPDPPPASAGATDEGRIASLELAIQRKNREISELEERISQAKPPTEDPRLRELEKERDRLKSELEQERARASDLASKLKAAEQELAIRSSEDEPPPKDPTIADLVQKHAPAVVLVRTDLGSGAGFFVTAEGLAVTNYHVIARSRRITVEHAPDGKQRRVYAAVAYAVDARNDLALLKADTGQAVPVLMLADSDLPKVGDAVLTIGNPGVGDVILDYSVTNGILSSLARDLEGVRYLQTTAAINPGNSGGPLLDMKGRVVGVVTAKAADAESIGFAIPVETVRTFFEKRNSEFRVSGTLADWEAAHGAKFRHDTSGGIEIDGAIIAFVLDEERDRILALEYEKNSLLVVSMSERKVLRSVYTGSEPSALAIESDGRYAWVANSASKNLVRIDTKSGEIDRTIELPGNPHTMTLTKKAVWCLDQNGQVFVASLADKKSYSWWQRLGGFAWDPKKDKLIAAISNNVYDIDEAKVIAGLKKMAATDVKNFGVRNAIGTEVNAAMRGKMISAQGLSYTLQLSPLYIDSKLDRLYIARGVVKLSRLDAVQGVFKPNPYSLSSDPSVRAFMAKFPQLDQIQAVSPDGKWVANGTHLFSAERFTVEGELPVPAMAMQFSKDSSTLWIFDVINQVILPLPVKK